MWVTALCKWLYWAGQHLTIGCSGGDSEMQVLVEYQLMYSYHDDLLIGLDDLRGVF